MRSGGDPRGSGVLLALLCLVLASSSLPLGANRDWAWTALAFALCCLVLGWVLAAAAGRPRPAPGLPERACLLAVAAWVAYASLYLLPMPSAVVEWLAPGVHAAYSRAYELQASPDASYYLTIDRHATLQALLKYFMYAAALFLVTVLVTNRARLKLALYAVLASGVGQVLLALWARAMDVELTPRTLMDGHWEVLRGTFVNRNHFAAFLAMTAGAGIGLLLAHIKRSRARGSLRARVSAGLEAVDGPVLAIAGAVLLIGAGMILSMSRGGIGALCVSVLAVLILAVAARGRRTREMFLLWPLGLVMLGALAWSGSRNLLDRVLHSGLVLDERWVQWAGTRELIADHWLTGTGPGTYQYAFTAYKSAELRPLLYDHAHNDYLQLMAEQGVTGFALLSLVVILLLSRLVRSFMVRRDILVRGALFASLTGMLAMLIHSAVEFNFQIPANALFFWVLGGIGLAAARLESREDSRYGSRPGSGQRNEAQ